MRLHHLSATAFGPFAEEVRVDLDDLARDGLFLLTGATGAGKTSVLDAVCFALYGEVPGDRHTARHLRSDHAAPDVAPRVELEASISGRRFRFTRSPAWERPKRRGGGTTRVPAHVLVEEARGGEWQALTNRLDEAGQLVADLLGMTCAQFTQVAMLPQGRFQAFLRASSADRQAVLQRLFRTRRFEDVERWLVERRLDLGRRSQVHHERTLEVLARLQEASGQEAPAAEDPGSDDLAERLDDGSLSAWPTALRAHAETALADVAVALAGADEALTAARRSLEAAEGVAAVRQRGAQARATLAALDETAAEESEVAAALEAHRRAAPVLPLSLRVQDAEVAVREARTTARDRLVPAALRLAMDLEEASDAEVLLAGVTRAHAQQAVAESWLPREAEVQVGRRRLGGMLEELHRDERAHDDALRLSTALGVECEGLRPRLAAAEEAASDHAEASREVEEAQRGLRAATQVVRLGAALEESTALLRVDVEHAQSLKEAWLDLRERRIEGMAAELAGALVSGCSCPVCGSAEHPSPASAAGRVGREAEDAARRAHEDADFARQTRHEQVSSLRAELAGAQHAAAGLGVVTWRERSDAATTRLEEAATATAEVAGLRARLAEAEQRLADSRATVAALDATLVQRRLAHAEAAERHQVAETALTALLAGTPATSVRGLVRHHRETARLLDAGREALAARERAETVLDQAHAAAGASALDAGFDSAEEAVAALLPGHTAAEHARALERRRTSRTAATAVLDEPAVAAALGTPAPDLHALERAADLAGAERDRLHTDHERAARRVQRLGALGRELDRVLNAWEPVRRDHLTVSALASLVEGKSTDNRLRMRLSAYVLAERLAQVVAAANERLGTMTDHRFSLARAEERGAGEQRGGLSLRVRDEWSGTERDPATLSGGETFLVSLALALGLADVVSHEAGGTQLDTLFIDEGFGALDATTLDRVMDILDGLREGGRVVGLVSHVAELRDRVNAQLEVRPAPRGSTLGPVGAGRD